MSRYASIWFPYLLAEYTARKKPELRDVAFVLASRQRGRLVVDAINQAAAAKGIRTGNVVADCKAIFPDLEVLETEPGRVEKVLYALAEWCIRYTPIVAMDMPDGLILDTTGCAHLWGGEPHYLQTIEDKLRSYGYTVKTAIADTIGTAWAMARFSQRQTIVKPSAQYDALQNLPPEALRLEPAIVSKLKKLGFQRIGDFIHMPASMLRRRFGPDLPFRIGQALGKEIEQPVPVEPVEPYQERLTSLDPIATATGITIALERLLETLCIRLEAEGMGIRQAVLKAYRIDGDVQQIGIGTGLASRNASHLFRLFEHKIGLLEPGLGFEVFVLEAPKVEPVVEEQAAIWNTASHNDTKVGELLDRITARVGQQAITRFLPDEHYWPERSIRQASPLWEKPSTEWRTDLPRPIHLLTKPEVIEVTAVLPDYPPMLFRHKGKLHTVTKSDGPERIEQEWWLADGLYRDYYCVEDETGARYWLFRSGPYDAKPDWFLHGFFA